MNDSCNNCVHRKLCDHCVYGGLCDGYDSEQYPRATQMLGLVMFICGATMLALVIWMNL